MPMPWSRDEQALRLDEDRSDVFECVDRLVRESEADTINANILYPSGEGVPPASGPRGQAISEREKTISRPLPLRTP